MIKKNGRGHENYENYINKIFEKILDDDRGLGRDWQPGPYRL